MTELETSTRLSPKQLQAVGLLLTHSVQDVANMVGVTDRSVYHWLENQEFTYELQKAQGLVISQVASRLTGLQIEVIDTLQDSMKNGDTDATKVRAAKYLGDYFLKFAEIKLLHERLDKLEGVLSERIASEA